MQRDDGFDDSDSSGSGSGSGSGSDSEEDEAEETQDGGVQGKPLALTADEKHQLHESARALSRGPILVLAYERVEAVACAQALVGKLADIVAARAQTAATKVAAESEESKDSAAEDDDTEEEEAEIDANEGMGEDEIRVAALGITLTLPGRHSLRRQLGESTSRCGVRCSVSVSSAIAERELFFDPSHAANSADGNGGGASQRRDWGISQRVSMAALMDFIFPRGVQHPLTRGRLFAFALYGPLDRHSRLRSGTKGEHVVTTRELDTMCRTIAREDILAVYANGGLSPEEEEELLAQADSFMKMVPEYDADDITDILRGLPQDEFGLYSFHDVQHAISKERARHVMRLKGHVDAALKRRNKTKRLVPDTLKVSAAQKSLEAAQPTLSRYTQRVAPQTMFDHNVGKTGEEVNDAISRALCVNSFKITHIEGGNDPNLVENVRLLCEDRDNFKDKPDAEKWDNNCCVRKQLRGTWVKTRNTPGYGLGLGYGTTKTTYSAAVSEQWGGNSRRSSRK